MRFIQKYRKIKKFFNEKREIVRQGSDLNKIETLGCNVENLRSCNIEIENLFACKRTETEWLHTIKKIETFNIPDGTGGVNPGDRRAIYYLIRKLKPLSVLEIGSFIGASTVHIGTALWSQHNAKRERDSRLVSVDITAVNDPVTKPWQKYGTKHSPIEMVSKLGFSEFVDFVTANSIEYLASCKDKFDFIFLDGDHTAKTVYQEIPFALNLLKKDGVILLHDYYPDLKPLWDDGNLIPGPYLAINRLIKEGADISVKPLGELPWPTKLNSNVTSLALLLRNQN